MMSGQLLFNPDADAPKAFTYGSANMRNFDGALAAIKNTQGELETRALCMRLRAEWYPDWWNRNNISTPTTPVVERLKKEMPDLPLPPVATARGEVQVSVTGALAFQNGVIAVAGTGNDSYCNGFADGTPCETSIKLPDGKVPTALAQTAMNEFLFATVWDVKARKGQLAVIAMGSDGPSSVSVAHNGRRGWGTQSWPTIHGMKLLGFVDLPMVAPTSLSVSLSTGTGSFRGTDDWYDNLSRQSVRDAWYNRKWNDGTQETMWKQLAGAGYAVVASRAENKVAFVDLRPLVNYYRTMYLTSQANWDQTAQANQGPNANQWPYTFTYAPAQTPKVLATLEAPQPTAVYARQRSSGTNGRAGFEGLDWMEKYKHTWVASMDGTLRQYDVESLGNPTLTPKAPSVIRTVKVGPNPTQLAGPIKGDVRNDDLFVVSRGSRAVHVLDFKGTPLGVLRDTRMQDPVFVAVGANGAGYGGAGAGKAIGARVLTVLDYEGKQVHDYGMYVENVPGRTDPWSDEQWPYLGPDGKKQQFQHGFSNKLDGKPFMFSFDEVI